MITQLAFRVDPDSGFAFAAARPRIHIDLSTTAKAPDGLSATFANNTGADNTVVFPAGPLTLASTATAAADGVTKNLPAFAVPAGPFGQPCPGRAVDGHRGFRCPARPRPRLRVPDLLIGGAGNIENEIFPGQARRLGRGRSPSRRERAAAAGSTPVTSTGRRIFPQQHSVRLRKPLHRERVPVRQRQEITRGVEATHGKKMTNDE